MDGHGYKCCSCNYLISLCLRYCHCAVVGALIGETVTFVSCVCSHPSHMHRSPHCPKIVTLLKLEIRTDNERGTRTSLEKNWSNIYFIKFSSNTTNLLEGNFFKNTLSLCFFPKNILSLSLPSAKVRRIGVRGTIRESEKDQSARDRLGLLLWAKVCWSSVKTKRVWMQDGRRRKLLYFNIMYIYISS